LILALLNDVFSTAYVTNRWIVEGYVKDTLKTMNKEAVVT